MKSRWIQALEQAERQFSHVPVARLSDMSVSPDAATRRLAVALIQKQADDAEELLEYVPILRSLVADPDHSCRWQSQIQLSEFIYTGDPEIAWEVVVEHADSEDDDLRGAIACVLLEHLLDEHFEDYFPRVRELALRGSPRLIDTIRTCWVDDIGQRKRQLQNLVARARRGRSSED